MKLCGAQTELKISVCSDGFGAESPSVLLGVKKSVEVLTSSSHKWPFLEPSCTS